MNTIFQSKKISRKNYIFLFFATILPALSGCGGTDNPNYSVETESESNNQNFNSTNEELVMLPHERYTSTEEQYYTGTPYKNTSNLSSGAIVELYEHCNYEGHKVSLPLGEFNLSNLIEKGLINDTVSSIKVRGGFQTSLFEHDFFAGQKKTFEGNLNCLVGANFNDSTSSIKVETIVNSPVVQLFEHCNYTGAVVEVPIGKFNLSTLHSIGTQNDNVSSIRVAEGHVAQIFEHDNFSGKSLKVDSNTDCLVGVNFNDLLSSLEVSKNTQPSLITSANACFYDKPNFEGSRECVNLGDFRFLHIWNDKPRSVTLDKGIRMEVFEHIDYQGKSHTLNNSISDLSVIGMDNTISSFKLFYPDMCKNGTDCGIQSQISEIKTTDYNGGELHKGEAALLNLYINPTYTGQEGFVKITPFLTSLRFHDYENVNLGTIIAKINPHFETRVSIIVPQFISDLTTGKRFALGAGDYSITKVSIENANGHQFNDTEYAGKNFTVHNSHAVLPLVLYNNEYFDKQNYQRTAQQYLQEVFTRPSQIYNNENNQYTYHSGGFDQMLNTKHITSPVPVLPKKEKDMGHCEYVGDVAADVIKLPAGQTWGKHNNNNQGVATSIRMHGFDTLIGLDGHYGGGVACGWMNTQISGHIGNDTNRQQIVAIHETGHIMGAPHCDPIQGYVMCSGEKHDLYKEKGLFIWLDDSFSAMANRFN